MADSGKFGSPKVLQFGDKTAGNRAGDSGHCAECEAMLADALDGTLSTGDRALFDQHMAECGPCGQLLADAKRGAAWLELLRTPAPEPPAALLERILAQTSAQNLGQTAVAGHIAPVAMPAAVMMPGHAMAASGKVIPFRNRFAAAFLSSSFGQIVLQPRLAMTAAMAFFSIGLTMNLTGVRLQDLRASNFTPSSLKRHFYSADARVEQYYTNLRVVYELESRVHDLQSASDNDTTPAVQSAPENPAPAAQPPAAQPDSGNPKAAPHSGGHPGSSQPEQRKPAPGAGTSRREEMTPSRRLWDTKKAEARDLARAARSLA